MSIVINTVAVRVGMVAGDDVVRLDTVFGCFAIEASDHYAHNKAAPSYTLAWLNHGR